MKPIDEDWASHIPVLVRASQITNGPVLELGVGALSTPLLHMLCFDKGVPLVSYENHPGYFNLVRKLNKGTHKIKLITDWDSIEPDIKSVNWGFVFIDHAPHERRMIEARKLANNAEFLIIHDSSDDLYGTGYGPIYPLFKYRFEYRKSRNHTVVLSNVREFVYE